MKMYGVNVDKVRTHSISKRYKKSPYKIDSRIDTESKRAKEIKKQQKPIRTICTRNLSGWPNGWCFFSLFFQYSTSFDSYECVRLKFKSRQI